MTVEEIRSLSPEQMNRIAAIRTEIENLELELKQILQGEKPRPPKPKPVPKPKKKAARRNSASKKGTNRETGEREGTAIVSQPNTGARIEGVLARLALPRANTRSATDLEG